MLLPILTYHAIGEHRSPLWIPEAEFDAHLAALQRAGYRATGLGEALRELESGTAARTVAITFDDGYGSFARAAWPRLRDRGFSATVFVITGRAGADNRWRGQPGNVPREELLGWDELAALAAEGCDLGAHSRSHSPLPMLSRDAIQEEVAGSREDIRTRTGSDPTVFAYPYGATNEIATAEVKRCYQAAVGTVLGLASLKSDRFLLQRIDAWYISARTSTRLTGLPFRMYLGARRGLRGVKRLARPDWDPGGGQA